MNRPDIAVIIVNYGTANLTIQAVNSVFDQDVDRRVGEIHVVDNASVGNDVDHLRDAHRQNGWNSHVVLHAELVNHGFGAGNNIVLKALADRDNPPDYVFLLNPDARLDNNATGVLAAFLDQTPEAGAAGAGIRKPDGTAVTAAFRFPGILSEFAQQASFGPIARILRRWQAPLPPDQPEGKVDWVAGAAVLFRMQALQDADFFDQKFFLYYEEVDLMRRMNIAGWQTWFVPKARVVHVEGAATGVKSGETIRKRKPRYWYDSWCSYFWKSHGRTGAILVAVAFLLGTAVHHTTATLLRRSMGSPLHVFKDFWRHAMRPLLTGKRVSNA